ncbi:MAG TPA: PilN domain-containing protein [Hyphomicrobiaceae bacterium]|nr:PilN domain-containing protein [Hyphomicrobiaceae bacterium]
MLRTLERVGRGPAAFLRWWVDELSGLVPAPLRKLVSGPRRRIVVAVHPRLQGPAMRATANSGELLPELRVLEEHGAQLRPIGPSAATGEPLAELARSTPRMPIGIRLPFDACFARRIALPAAARNNFRSILSLDLERATPFRAGDVYASHFVEDPIGENGKLTVRQVVVKRTTLDPLIAEIEAIGLRVSFADCWGEDGRTGLPVNFLEPSPKIASPFGKPLHPNAPLLGLALVLVCSAIFLVVHKHESALAQLQSQIAHAKGEARNVRRLLDRWEAALAQVASLRRMKGESIPVIQTLEELTRLLPDSAWLTDLRIEGHTVELSGLAKSAADLLAVLERSAMFTEAALAAPLTLEHREDKERFSVRVRIRRHTPEQAASRGGKSG